MSTPLITCPAAGSPTRTSTPTCLRRTVSSWSHGMAPVSRRRRFYNFDVTKVTVFLIRKWHKRSMQLWLKLSLRIIGFAVSHSARQATGAQSNGGASCKKLEGFQDGAVRAILEHSPPRAWVSLKKYPHLAYGWWSWCKLPWIHCHNLPKTIS